MPATASKVKNYEFLEYKSYMEKIGGDNKEEYSRLMRNLRRAMREELTEKQLSSLERYYLDGLKMREIAEEQGVNVATVSRNVARGREKLKRCLRYGAKELLTQLSEDEECAK